VRPFLAEHGGKRPSALIFRRQRTHSRIRSCLVLASEFHASAISSDSKGQGDDGEARAPGEPVPPTNLSGAAIRIAAFGRQLVEIAENSQGP